MKQNAEVNSKTPITALTNHLNEDDNWFGVNVESTAIKRSVSQNYFNNSL